MQHTQIRRPSAHDAAVVVRITRRERERWTRAAAAADVSLAELVRWSVRDRLERLSALRDQHASDQTAS
jgi:hypothetical protein